MGKLALCGYHTSAPAVRRHQEVPGVGVFFVQEWPEHTARAEAAIRARRRAEGMATALFPDGTWR